MTKHNRGHNRGQKCPPVDITVDTFVHASTWVANQPTVDNRGHMSTPTTLKQPDQLKPGLKVGKMNILVRNMYIQTNADFMCAPDHFCLTGVDIVSTCPPLMSTARGAS